MVINNYIERFKFLILSLVVLLGAVLIETNVFEQRFSRSDVHSFQHVFTKKDKLAQEILEELNTEYQKKPDYSTAFNYWESNSNLLSRRGISLYVFENSKLTFWSSNDYYIEDLSIFEPSLYKVIYIDHSWVMVNRRDSGNYSYVALSLVKHEYLYENDFLENEFHPDFSLTQDVGLTVKSSLESYTIVDSEGNYALSMSPKAVRKKHIAQKYISISMYFIGIALLLFFLNNFLMKFKKRFYVDVFNVSFLVVVALLRYWMVSQKVPFVFQSSDLFDPQYYASSVFLPSLGDLLINSMFLVYFIYQISVRLRNSPVFSRPISRVANFYAASIFLAAYFILNTYLFKTLILNSNITFVAYKILDVGFLTFVGFFILALLYGGYIFLLDSIVHLISNYWSIQKTIFLFFPVVLIVASASYFFGFDKYIILTLVFFILFLLVSIVRMRMHGDYRLSVKVLLIATVSAFIMHFINHFHAEKQVKLKKHYAINLANEQDIVAEILLSDIEKSMNKDSILQYYMAQPIDKEDKINDYLKKKYFSGFFTKYNLETTICSNSPQFSKYNQASYCKSFFDKQIDEFGIRLLESKYFFLNNQNGSISYLSTMKFDNADAPDTYLYITLNSKLISEELGYPELLLEKPSKENKLFSQYDYAKYENNQLVSQKGDFTYEITDAALPNFEGEYYQYISNGYEHLLYRINKNSKIVVSNEEISYYDSLISFSYVFVFLFLLTVFIEGVSFFPGRFQVFNFRAKIQISIISMLLISVFVVGGSMVYLNIKQFRESQNEQISEKVQSVLVELEHKLAGLKNIYDEDPDYIAYLLTKFSNVFYSDINLYDLEGNLVASSRPEVFDYGLLGLQINPQAYKNVAISKKTRFIQTEYIGNQDYMSAYSLFKNEDNVPLAVLNLPYFTKQSVLTNRVSVLVVAIVNVYVLLFLLSTVIAVFIAEKITDPLQILKERFQQIKVGGDNKKIEWKSNDEIGGLIRDYNRMVDELELSAIKLAESERNSAWHKMARQVAHEIKNPLTPMKLNLQLLHRAWENKSDDFGSRLKKVSDSIIEQIDALAETADEFSNFSKMKELDLKPINIGELLDNCLQLFESHENITIINTSPSCNDCFVLADKDRLLRVFNNIIKNAVQAIPKEKQGTIRANIKEDSNFFTVSIEDNGKGISPELHDKLFEPNFTTKTHGMGLGLAISAQIVKNMNGSICFDSEVGKGTTFYVQLPKAT